MTSLDPNSYPNTVAQPPPPPLPPPSLVAHHRDDKEQRAIPDCSQRDDRIQRSLDAMTARHSRDDVQRLVFRYLQQAGYLRSAMSFAYECMLSSGQQQQQRHHWNPRHSHHELSNNGTKVDQQQQQHSFLHNRQQQLPHHSGAAFAQLLQHHLNNDSPLEKSEMDHSNNDKNYNKPPGSILSVHDQPRCGGQGIMVQPPATAAFYIPRCSGNAVSPSFSIHDGPPAPSMTTDTSICTISYQQAHPIRYQHQRKSSPLGSIFLFLVIYALFKLGSWK